MRLLMSSFFAPIAGAGSGGGAIEARERRIGCAAELMDTDEGLG